MVITKALMRAARKDLTIKRMLETIHAQKRPAPCAGR